MHGLYAILEAKTTDAKTIAAQFLTIAPTM